MSSLFFTVMEAEGDLLEPFSQTEEPPMDMPEQQQDQTPEQPPADMGADSPPEATDMEDLSLDDTGGEMDDAGSEGDDSGGESEKNDEKLSEKANDILNQRLYQKMLERNSEIEENIENIQTIIPLLPYKVVSKNDLPLNRLKRALTKGQEYVLHDFVNAGYGENLRFYHSLNSLYNLLQDEIDSNLKEFQKDE